LIYVCGCTCVQAVVDGGRAVESVEGERTRDGDPAPPFDVLLRRQRAVAGLTQEELAERAGVSVRSIGELERGAGHRPRKDTVRLLAEALGLSPDAQAVFAAAARPRRAPTVLHEEASPSAGRPASEDAGVDGRGIAEGLPRPVRWGRVVMRGRVVVWAGVVVLVPVAALVVGVAAGLFHADRRGPARDVGGSATVAGVTVMISPATRDRGEPSDPLGRGDVFQVVRLTIRNHGAARYDYGGGDFVLLDGGARTYHWATPGDSDLPQPIDGGRLAPGDAATGELSFEVPAGAVPAAVRWESHALDTDAPDNGPGMRIVPLPGRAVPPGPAGPIGRLTAAGITVSIGPALRRRARAWELADPGDVFQVVRVTIQNRSRVAYFYGDLTFTLLDGGAREYDPTFGDAARPLLMASLKPGATVTGMVTFEAPAGTTPVAVRWDASGLGPGRPPGDQVILLPR